MLHLRDFLHLEALLHDLYILTHLLPFLDPKQLPLLFSSLWYILLNVITLHQLGSSRYIGNNSENSTKTPLSSLHHGRSRYLASLWFCYLQWNLGWAEIKALYRWLGWHRTSMMSHKSILWAIQMWVYALYVSTNLSWDFFSSKQYSLSTMGKTTRWFYSLYMNINLSWDFVSSKKYSMSIVGETTNSSSIQIPIN